ncbi:hypothetical protein [Synechococcus sp. M16CYN]|uniref:hypothetical protein n=1 Tax=Synechococcus sp. M16CYN TaxID=3103139 RepID=UPI00334051A3
MVGTLGSGCLSYCMVGRSPINRILFVPSSCAGGGMTSLLSLRLLGRVKAGDLR